MSQNEKFNALVSKEKTTTVARSKERIKNRAMLRESQEIAMKVLEKLDELGWTQKRLAEELNVSPQQVTKLVSGKENLTLETQVKLQNALDIPILATYFTKKMNRRVEVVNNVEMTYAAMGTHMSLGGLSKSRPMIIQVSNRMVSKPVVFNPRKIKYTQSENQYA